MRTKQVRPSESSSFVSTPRKRDDRRQECAGHFVQADARVGAVDVSQQNGVDQGRSIEMGPMAFLCFSQIVHQVRASATVALRTDLSFHFIEAHTISHHTTSWGALCASPTPHPHPQLKRLGGYEDKIRKPHSRSLSCAHALMHLLLLRIDSTTSSWLIMAPWLSRWVFSTLCSPVPELDKSLAHTVGAEVPVISKVVVAARDELTACGQPLETAHLLHVHLERRHLVAARDSPPNYYVVSVARSRHF